MTSLLQSFSFCFFQTWWKVLTNKIISYLPGQRKMSKNLLEAVNSYQKQEEQRKNTFLLKKKILQKILEQSQSSETKRKTKWVLKYFQGKKQLLCFVLLTNPKSKIFMRLVYQIFFSQSLNNRYIDWCHEFTIQYFLKQK